MSQYIFSEASFFLSSFFMGVIITFTYDGFIILRRSFHHSLLLVSLEDLLFWMACAISVFLMLYEKNNGILRWFSIFAATIGMLIYKKTLSSLVVNIMSTIIAKIIHILLCVVRFIIKPIRFIFRKISCIYAIIHKKIKKFMKYCKLVLTRSIKLLKITLCKH